MSAWGLTSPRGRWCVSLPAWFLKQTPSYVVLPCWSNAEDRMLISLRGVRKAFKTVLMVSVGVAMWTGAMLVVQHHPGRTS